MSLIYLARHAESIANTEGIYQGHTYDTDLSLLGRKQAEVLAKELAKFKIDHIVSSPLKRTYQTAMAVSEKTGLSVEKEMSIIETNHGLWEGRTKEWIKENYPELYEVWNTTPSKAKFPKGEKFTETFKRVKDYVLRNKWRGNTLIVAHDNIVRIMLCMACNRPVDDLWKFGIEPAAISIIEVIGVNGTKRLKSISYNNTKHLDSLRSDLSIHAL